jgi:AraC-like DNA-binding protein
LIDVRICDVALQAGFFNISHFNRLFRSRFGDTPKGVRAHARMGNTEDRLSEGTHRSGRPTGGFQVN